MKDNKKQEFITNKLLLTYVVGFVAIALTLWLSSAITKGSSALFVLNFLKVFRVVSVLGLLGSGIKLYLDIKNKKSMEMKYITSLSVFMLFAIMTGAACILEVISIVSGGGMYVVAYIIAVLLLYFVFVSFKKEYFILAFTNIACLATVFLATKFIDNELALVITALFVAFAIVVLYAISKLRKSNGVYKSIRILTKGVCYDMLSYNMYGLLAVSVASVVLAILGFNISICLAALYSVILLFYIISKNI